ncbi:polyhydroxyalkanoate biosynthesis repressor PhaR [Paenibacillus sp. BSR1-1]|uniref:polyhydroxyalkanoate biosynthesis repressor PhaR n=1 Tax=Paenibacillus sp. BSR1-1 TaxID=3020845 RepID=UPI0025B16A36|nr:polyhydroxyalkanoate biosynthesis repressor PhaR [Paenibacillus sp. BSR1-1]MDN3015010.1 polyhydroxyalkanoate biosynthesis repressor PhaR [Paenibacillus sp. BSR1-1]
MSSEKIIDPLFGFKQLSGIWDKQINDLLYKLTDNKEFVRTASFGLNTYSFYLERIRKNQELIAALMNIPTKKDIANAAKLSIQTEEKIDILEEQIWNLQDSVSSISKQNLEMFEEVENIVMQLKNEYQKMAQELAENQKIKDHLQELRKEIDLLKSIKLDLGIIEKDREKVKKESGKNQEKDLVPTGTNITK